MSEKEPHRNQIFALRHAFVRHQEERLVKIVRGALQKPTPKPKIRLKKETEIPGSIDPIIESLKNADPDRIEEEIRKAARILAAFGAAKGGKAAAAKRTPEERSSLASRAANTRWHPKESTPPS